MAQNTESLIWRRAVEPSRRCLVILALACIALSLLRPARAGADEPSVEQFVRKLESSYKGVNTLRVNFTQSYQWGNRSREESGTVYFARGGRMRWEYRTPEEKLFVSDGKSVLLYLPQEKQLTRSTVKASEDVRVPFRLLLSRLDLGKVFGHIEFADGSLEARAGDRVLRAIPKRGDDSGIHEVVLEITPDYDIRALVLVYSDGAKMAFTFESVERNVRVSPELFQFTPPRGTEVINQK